MRADATRLVRQVALMNWFTPEAYPWCVIAVLIVLDLMGE